MVLGAVAKLIGNKNSIRVFREILKDGKVVTTSFKGEIPFKTVTQTLKSTSNSREITANVINHTTGKATTYYNSLKQDGNVWTRFWKKNPNNLSTPKTILQRQETIDGNFRRIADTTYKVKDDGYLSFTRIKGKHGNNMFTETHINADNWQMSNGTRITSQHAKSTYNNETFNSLRTRPYYIYEGPSGIVGGNRLA